MACCFQQSTSNIVFASLKNFRISSCVLVYIVLICLQEKRVTWKYKSTYLHLRQQLGNWEYYNWARVACIREEGVVYDQGGFLFLGMQQFLRGEGLRLEGHNEGFASSLQNVLCTHIF